MKLNCCILFFLVPRATVFSWNQGVLYECSVIVGCFLVVIPCKRLVDNKYSRYV